MKGQFEPGVPDRAAGRRLRGISRGRLAARRFASFVTGGFFLAVAVFLFGFAAFGLHVAGLRTPADQPGADAIIALTGGQARLDAAVELLKSGKGRRLLISGVNPVARVADLQQVTGADADLFSCCVDIDHAALDTIGNAEESAKWVNSHGYGRVIVVTNNYHMPRSLLEMRRLVTSAELLPYPVVNSRLDRGEWMTKPDAMRVIFTEYVKYVAALGRVVVPAIASRTDAERMKAAAGG